MGRKQSENYKNINNLDRDFRGMSCSQALDSMDDAVYRPNSVRVFQSSRRHFPSPYHASSFGRSDSHDARSNFTTTSDICEAIEKNLLEWGVTLNRVGKHEKFADYVIKLAIQDFKYDGPTKNDGNEYASTIPSDKDDAIRYVLRTELETATEKDYYDADDKVSNILKRQVPFPPYWINRSCEPVLKNEFDLLKPYEILLDPFRRFKPIVLNRKEYYRQYFLEESKELCLQGNIFEAIVVSHAIHDTNVCCKSCGSSGSLKWMGGYGTSWKDMLCVVCNSTYEIKSKKDSKQVEKALFDYKSVNGGSFSRWRDLTKETKKHPEAKNYLVLVGRDYVFADRKSHAKQWNVHIAEIKKVLPRIDATSFVKPLEKVRLKSVIQVKDMVNRNESDWFQIPHFEFNQAGIASEVFRAHDFTASSSFPDRKTERLPSDNASGEVAKVGEDKKNYIEGADRKQLWDSIKRRNPDLC